jgi:hypothetical protein
MNHKLLAMLVCAVLLHAALCARAAEPQTEQEEAIAENKKVGGKVTIDEKSPGREESR